MKISFYILFTTLFLTSCSPKFQEYNDNGFGGGGSTAKSQQLGTKKTGVTIDNQYNSNQVENNAAITYQELNALSNQSSTKSLPKVIRIKSNNSKNNKRIFQINESEKTTQHFKQNKHFKNRLKSILSTSKLNIFNFNSIKFKPAKGASFFSWFLYVLGWIIAIFSIAIIIGGAGDPMFGAVLVPLGIIWFNYSLVLLFGSKVIDHLDQYTKRYKHAVIWSIISPILLFLPAIFSIPIWFAESKKKENQF